MEIHEPYSMTESGASTGELAAVAEELAKTSVKVRINLI